MPSMLATTTRNRRACLLALAGLAVLSGSASANTYCVADSACVAAGGTDENGLVQQALNAAQAHAGLDRVQIGSGAFTLAAGFSYLDTNPANGVQVVGSGRNLTTLTTTGNVTVLAIQGAASTVSDLAIAIPGGNDIDGLALTGGSSAQRVDVTANAAATQVAGFDLYTGGNLSDVTVTLPAGVSNVGINQRSGAGSLVVSGAVLNSTVGIQTASTGSSTYRRVVMKNTATGLTSSCGSVVLEDSSIRFKAGNAGVTGSPGPSPGCPGATDTVAVRHVTMDGDGAGNPIGVQAVSTVAGSTNNVSVRDTTMTNVNTALRRFTNAGTTNITTAYSNFDPATDSDSNTATGAGQITSTHQLNVSPGFVSAADDHLAAGSPLIDAGDPAGLAAGESALDLGGAARILDGTGNCTARQDIGAYEFVPAALGAVTAGGPSQATVGSGATFTATACSPNPAATLGFAWDFGDGSSGSGASVSHVYSTAGARTITLTVSDSDGRSSVRTLAVSVVDAVGGVSPGAGSPSGGSPAGPQGGSPAGKHCVVPRLRGLTLSSARRRLKAAGCALGKLRSPRTRGRLVVRSSSPGAGAKLRLGARVALRMALAPPARHHHG
jgi:hypothetical protein